MPCLGGFIWFIFGSFAYQSVELWKIIVIFAGMKTKEYMIRLLLEEVELKAGRRMEMPKDFENLWHMLPHDGKLGVSTLKRLWGYVSGTRSARESTLSILSRFAGYQDWNDYLCTHEQLQMEDSDFLGEAICVDDVPIAGEILLGWFPNHLCRVRKQEDGTLLVIEAVGCKLQVGDTFRAMQISVGNPLYATHVIRNGLSLPDYVAGRVKGIRKIEVYY